jgi:tetratricopeptide (TPR) repeat protein
MSRKVDKKDSINMESVINEIEKAFNRINTKYLGSLMATFGMVRGDAFEGVLLTQHYAPQIVQDIIKAFYRLEKTIVRISVVLDELSATSSDRNKTYGPAYDKALVALDKMKERKSEHWLQVSFDVGSLGQALVDSQFALLTALTESWTDNQREAVWAMETLEDCQKNASTHLDVLPTISSKQLKIISEQLRTSPPVIKKQLKAAHYNVYRQAWVSLKLYLASMDAYTIKEKSVIEQSYVPWFNMGMHKMKRQDYSTALEFLEKSLQLAKNNLKNEDPLLILIYNALAEAYTRNERYEDAQGIIQKAFTLQESMPKARLQYLETLNAEAHLYLEKGDLLKAQNKYQEALDIAYNILDDGHPLLGKLYNNIANVYYSQNNFDNALELYKKSYNNTVISMGKDSIDYALTIGNIAGCYFYLNDNEKAIAYTKEALLLLEKNLPPNHDLTDWAKNRLVQFTSPDPDPLNFDFPQLPDFPDFDLPELSEDDGGE